MASFRMTLSPWKQEVLAKRLAMPTWYVSWPLSLFLPKNDKTKCRCEIFYSKEVVLHTTPSLMALEESRRCFERQNLHSASKLGLAGPPFHGSTAKTARIRSIKSATWFAGKDFVYSFDDRSTAAGLAGRRTSCAAFKRNGKRGPRTLEWWPHF